MAERNPMVIPATRPRNPFGKAPFSGNAGKHQKPHKTERARVKQDLRTGRYQKPSSLEGFAFVVHGRIHEPKLQCKHHAHCSFFGFAP